MLEHLLAIVGGITVLSFVVIGLYLVWANIQNFN